ncbi:MAG: hypothetical protein REJ50_26265, partial [Bordetella sp.]|nr:hypothetical protein [Bordetella sp.]
MSPADLLPDRRAQAEGRAAAAPSTDAQADAAASAAPPLAPPFRAPFPIRSAADVRRIEATPLAEALTVQSTYEIFRNSAAAFGDAPALTFLRTADPDDTPIRWSYRALLGHLQPEHPGPLRHLGLRRVVGRPEGDVVHRAAAGAAGQEVADLAQRDPGAEPGRAAVAGERALAAGLLEAEHLRQHPGGGCRLAQHQRHAVEAADCVLDRDRIA